MILLFVLFMLLLLSFRAAAGILGYIEASREAQRGIKETIETVENSAQGKLAEEVPSLAATAAAAAVPAESDATLPAESAAAPSSGAGDGELDSSDPTHILSGGRYIDSTKPMIAFTFDDGPKTEIEQQLTDALEQVNGRATFFLIGNRTGSAAEHVKQMSEHGHEIANHSWDHDTKMNKKDVDYIRNEFTKTDETLQSITGKEVLLYRLPGGNISDNVRTALKKPMIYWSIDTEDWKFRRADHVISEIRGKVHDGDIVLMHSLYQSTADACKTLIPELAAQGYQFVTVSELIALRGEGVTGGNGKQYKKFPPLAAPSASGETAAAETTAVPPTDTAPAENVSAESTTAETTRESTAAAPLSADTILVGPGAGL